jgi:hypothetical protein
VQLDGIHPCANATSIGVEINHASIAPIIENEIMAWQRDLFTTDESNGWEEMQAGRTSQEQRQIQSGISLGP